MTDPNADLEHTNETRWGEGGDCLTCGVKWPCPTEVRRRDAVTLRKANPLRPVPRFGAA